MGVILSFQPCHIVQAKNLHNINYVQSIKTDYLLPIENRVTFFFKFFLKSCSQLPKEFELVKKGLARIIQVVIQKKIKGQVIDQVPMVGLAKC